MATGQQAQDTAIEAGLSNYYSTADDIDKVINDLSTPIDTVDEQQDQAKLINAQAKGRANREQSRYGIRLTPAERQQQARLLQTGGQTNIVTAGNMARRDDQNSNLSRLVGLEKLSNSLFESASDVTQGLGEMSADRYSQYQRMRGQANSSRAGFYGGLAKLGGAVAGALVFSDKKLKNNIKLVGKNNGHNIYKWDWNDTAKKLGINSNNTGVIAQEVIQYKPEAVYKQANGYYMVDYGAL